MAGPVPQAPLERLLYRLATGLAVCGGLVLIALVLMTVASILGRSLLGVPVPGDFELVEIGCALAVFAFLPYCQLTRANVSVDFFTAGIGARSHALLDAMANLLYTLIAALLTWRAAIGGIELHGYQESSMVLQVPLWWGFIPAVICLACLTLVCAYTLARDLTAFVSGGGALP